MPIEFIDKEYKSVEATQKQLSVMSAQVQQVVMNMAQLTETSDFEICIRWGKLKLCLELEAA
ncbi:MAG: hypothetical protein ABI262_08825 [Microcoleus sp.]|jgi:hypothetical protein